MDETSSLEIVEKSKVLALSYDQVFGSVPSGYTFKGWATSAGGSVKYSSGGPVTNSITGNIDLFAVWSYPTTSAQILYQKEPAAGGTVSPASELLTASKGWFSNKYTYDEPEGSTALPAKGYTFKGWYKGDTLVTTNETLSRTILLNTDQSKGLNYDKNTNYTNSIKYENTTYTAKFVKDSVITYTADPKDKGSVSVSSETASQDAPPAGSTASLKGGSEYYFDGWYTGGSKVSSQQTLSRTVIDQYAKKNGEYTDTTFTARFLPYQEMTLTAKNASVKYNGSFQSGEDYTGLPEGKQFSASQLAQIRVSGGGTDAGTYKLTFADGAPAVLTATDGTVFKVAYNDGKLTIGKRAVTLTSGSGEKEYDGLALTNDSVETGGDGFVAGEGATFRVTGTQTIPGTSKNTFTYDLKDGTRAGNYDITTEEGTLKVEGRKTPHEVTLTAKSLTVKYDGEKHTVSGLLSQTFRDNGVTYTVEGVTAEATATHAGTKETAPEGTAKVLDPEGNDVTSQFAVTITPGQLVIQPRTLTLTSGSSEKEYDGKALTNGTVTVSGDGFAKGEGAEYKVTGSQKTPGASANKFEYSLNSGTLADDYQITKTEGTLNVLNRNAKYEITVEANSGSESYDGTEKTVTGIKENTFKIGGNTYTVGGLSAVGAGTHAGTYDVNISGTPTVSDEDGSDVTKEFAISLKKGTLTIGKRAVTLTSASAEKEFDGTPLRNSEVTISEGSFAKGEGASFTVTGGRVYPGSGKNTFTYTLNQGTLAEDYEITCKTGTLTVTDRKDKYSLEVKGKSGSFLYDGQEHVVSGFQQLTFQVDGLTYTVEGLQASAAGTDVSQSAGEIPIEGTAVVRDAKGVDVTSQFEVVKTSGSLEIKPRNLTMESASAEKEYDGTPLKAEGVTVGGDGFVAGEGAAFQTYGYRTYPGTAENHFRYQMNAGTKEDNYKITQKEGTLTVTDRKEKFPITVIGNSGSFLYDGQEHAVSGFTSLEFDVNGMKYTVEGIDASASGTSAADSVEAVEITGTPVVKDEKGKNVTAQFDVTLTPGSFTIRPREVTLTSGSAVKAYDGHALTVSDVVTGGDGFVEGEEPEITVTGTILLPGSVKNEFSYELPAGVKKGNYVITTEEGVLEITDRDPREITLTANSDQVKYDGGKHTVSGFDRTNFTDNQIVYTISGIEAQAEGTHAGTVKTAITGKAKITDPDGNDVTKQFAVKVTEGSLQILPRTVTLTSASAEKEYDGQALTASEVEAGGDGFAKGEGADYTVTGSQKRVGSSTNAFTYKLKEGTRAEDYDITTCEGTLNVTPRGAKYQIEVTANSAKALYDGTEKSASGLKETTFTVDGNEYTVSGLKAEGTGINAGTYPVTITGTPLVKDAEGADVTNQFAVSLKDGKLVIGKRTVTLTSGSAEREYDGTPLTCEDVTVGGDGFVKGEGAAYTFHGYRTYPGTAENHFRYDLKPGTSPDNYEITTEEGTLTIADRSKPFEITVKGTSGEFLYDGQKHTVSGFETLQFDVDGRHYTVEGLESYGEAVNVDSSVPAVSITGEAVVRDASGVDVTCQFAVSTEAGSLQIQPRKVVLSSASASKEYDGAALTAAEVAVSGDGFVGDEGAEYNVTGSQLYPGTRSNAFTYVLKEGTLAGNYEISTTKGILEVTDRINKYEITVKGASGAFRYDGSQHAVSGFETLTFEVDGVTYTVEGLKSEASGTSVADSIEKIAIKGKAVVKDPSGEDVTRQFTVNKVSGSLSILPRDVTLTSASASKEYDGAALTADEITVTGHGWAPGEEPAYKVKGSQLIPGESANTFTYKLPEGVSADNYNITKTEGTLTVRDRAVPQKITVTAKSDQVKYDGKSHDVSGFESLAFQDRGAAYEISGIKASAEGTHAGTIETVITGTPKVTDAEGNDVTRQFAVTVQPGSLQIQPRALIFTSASAEKEYDGKALTNDKVEVTGDGFAKGEGADFHVTGSRKTVGSSVNDFTWTLKDGTRAGDYVISPAYGNLNVLNRSAKYQIEVTANSGKETYDGTAKSVSGIKEDTFEVEGSTYTVAGLTASAEGTNAGEYAVPVTGIPTVTDAEGNDVTEQFAVKLTNGKLVIGKKAVTMTSASAEREFNGKPLTRARVVSEGFTEGQGAEYTVTGSQTYPGTSDNEFTYVLQEGTLADNYDITVKKGTLTVKDRAEKYDITVKGASAEFLYDGTEHSIKGFETLTFTVDGVTYTVEGLTAGAKGTDVADSQKAVAIEGKAVVKDGSGTDVTGQFNVKTEPGSFVINKRSVILASASRQKEYDGIPLTAEEITTGGDGWAAEEGAKVKAAGVQSAVGSSENTIKYKLNENTKEDNYEITTTPGTLTVSGRIRNYTVDLVAKSGSFVYDGTSHSLSGFQPPYNKEEVIFQQGDVRWTITGLSASCEGTHVGEYENAVSGEAKVTDPSGNDVTDQFTIKAADGKMIIQPASLLDEGRFTVTGPENAVYNGEEQKQPVTIHDSVTDADLGAGSDYTIEYTEATNAGEVTVTITGTGNYAGTITRTYRILPAKLTVKTESASKVYDGATLAAAGTIEGFVRNGFFGEEKAPFIVTGAQTAVGESRNGYRIDWDDPDATAVRGNYEMVEELGLLTVEPNPEPVVLTAPSAAKTYDGTPLTRTEGASQRGLPEGHTFRAEVKGTQLTAGESENVITSYAILNEEGQDVTRFFAAISTVKGKLTVNKAPVVITTGSGARAYNGLSYTLNEAEIRGLIEGESAVVTATGSIIDVGTVDNGYSIDWGYTDPENYVITEALGKLTITETEDEVVLTAPSATKVYDGTPLTCSEGVTAAGLPDGFTVEAKAEGTQTDAGTSENKVAEGYVIRNANGQDRTASFKKVKLVPGTLEVTKAPLIVRTGNASMAYDGTEITADRAKVEGLAEGESITVKATGTLTDVGTAENTCEITWSGAKEDNYEVTVINGTLTVVANEQPITVTASSASKSYDGTPLENTGDVEVTGLPEGFTLEAVSEGSLTDAGETENVIKEYHIYNADKKDVTEFFTGVTFETGTLRIRKAVLKVETPDAEKVYDGEALTKAGTITGFAEGEEAELITTGTQTDVGTSRNTYEIKWNDKTKEANYRIEETVGQLTVTEYAETIDVTVTAGAFTYDGKEHGASVEVSGLPKGYTLEKAESSAKATNATDQPILCQADELIIRNAKGEDVTDKLNLEQHFGTLEIKPAVLTVETADGSKIYDGKALKGEGTIKGFAEGESAPFTVTGTQTAVGSSPNTFTIDWASDKATAKEQNYEVKETLGTLTVSENQDEIIIEAKGGTFTYDGKPHGAEVIVPKLPEGYTLEKAGSTQKVTDVSDGAVEALIDQLIIRNAEGEDVTDRLNLTLVCGTIQVSPATLTVTTPSETKVYDGESLTGKGSISGFVNGEEATFLTTGTQTEVGTSTNSYLLRWDKTAKKDNYQIEATLGSLTVTQSEDNIVVTAAGGNYVYDGKAHKAAITVSDLPKGYTLEKAESTVKVTDVTKEPVTVTADDLVIRNKSGKDVTDKMKITYVDGTITVTPAVLTVVTPDAEKVYDGEPLTSEGTLQGLVNGETATLATTGTQTDVGASRNRCEIKWDGTAKAENYVVNQTIGTLRVTEYAGEITVTTTGGTWTYDGKTHKASVSVSALPKGYTLETAKTEAKAKNFTERPVAATADELVIRNAAGEDVTERLNIRRVDGEIRITPAELTVTTPDAVKEYDGDVLSAKGSVKGFVGDEKATFQTTGSQKTVGESPNTWEITWDGSAKEENYTIREQTGTLRVIESTHEITVTVTGGTFTYDGTEHGASVSVSPLPKGYTLEEASSSAVVTDVTAEPVLAAADKLVIRNAEGEDVTSALNIQYVSDTLQVTPAKISVETYGAAKVYDGTPLTAEGRLKGLVGDETARLVLTGSQTTVGESPNAYHIDWSGTAKAGNYQLVSETIGTLVVSQSADEIVVTTTGGTWTYDGKKHGASVSVTGVPRGYKVKEASSDAAATNVTKASVKATADHLVIVNAEGEDVTDKLNIRRADGEIRILPAELTVITPDASAVYNGRPLTAEGTVTGFAAGETAPYKTTGSQTKVGSSKNTLEIQWKDASAKRSNYAVTEQLGTLTVSENTDEIVATANGGTWTYDGKSHRASVTVSPLPEGYTLEKAESTQAPVDVTTEDVTAKADDLIIRNAEGENVTSKLNITRKNGRIRILPAELVVETPDAERVYNGEELKAEGTIAGFVNGESAPFSTTGSQTNVGTSANTWTIDWAAKGAAKAGNYTIKSRQGTLTVREYGDEIHVITTGGSWTYDGKEHGATVSVSALPKGYKLEEASSTAVVKDVTAEPVRATADKLVIRNAAGKDVTGKLNINKLEGTLSVTPAELSVRTESASKVYDGSALTAAGSLTGLVEGETADFKVTGTQTDTGTSQNTWKIDWNGSAKEGNYQITEKLGNLTVTESEEEIVASVTGGTWTYDGQRHGAEVSVSTLPKGYYLERAASSAFAQDVTEEPVTAKADTIVIRNESGEDVTDKLKLKFVDGSIKIDPAVLIVETPGSSKVYDGTPLTAAGTIRGFVAGETAQFSTTGKQTDVGSSDNTYKIKWNGTAKEGNYTIQESLGTLTVEEYAGRITAVVLSSESVYDGEPHGAQVVVSELPPGYTLVEAASDATATDVTGEEGVSAKVDRLMIQNAAGEDVTSRLKIKKTEGVIVIHPAELTVTTPSVQKEYDGTPLTAEGSVEGFVHGETATFRTVGSQTSVGVSSNDYNILWDNTAKESNYTIRANIGTLSVVESSREIVAATTGSSTVYDGLPHGATVTVTGIPAGYHLEEAASGATATHVTSGGPVKATADHLVIFNAEGQDVTDKLNITYVDGSIEITPAPLNVETYSATKVYDGAAVTAGGSLTGLKNGESVSFAANGSQTEVGSSANTYSLAWDGTAQESDYVIAGERIGTLTVTENADEIVVVTTGGTWVYDGQRHGAEVSVSALPKGYVLTKAESTTTAVNVNGEGKRATADVLEIRNAEGKVVTDKLNIRFVDGMIQITPAPLTVITPDASKIYDGTELTADGEITGFVPEEIASFDTTGTQTEVGSSDNTYEIGWDKEEARAKRDNYDITESVGVLTVDPVPTHVLTIHYVDEKDQPVAESYAEIVESGAAYGPVLSPEVSMMTPDYRSLSGIMPEYDVELTVHYAQVKLGVIEGDAPEIDPDPKHTAKTGEKAGTTESVSTDAQGGNNGDAPAGIVITDEKDGVTIDAIDDGGVPLEQQAYWALWNLILVILSALISLVLLLRYFGKKKDEEEEPEGMTAVRVEDGTAPESAATSEGEEQENERKRKGLLRILSLGPVIVGIIVFILTEDMSNIMAMTDQWTILMAALFIAEIAIALLCGWKKQEDDPEDPEDNPEGESM